MKIGIIDCELLSNDKKKFPNLALMKLSSYHKKLSDSIELITYDHINPYMFFTEKYDRIYIAKVFTKTNVPKWIDEVPNIIKGGTGFYYDKSPKLDYEIEHFIPDYNLYNNYFKFIGNKYDNNFFKKDFEFLLKRIELIYKYNASVYIMRYDKFELSPYKKYISKIKILCNSPVLIGTKSIEEAALQSKYFDFVDFMNKNYRWFLKIKQNHSYILTKNKFIDIK